MRVCVLGANGKVGRRVVARALAQGHEVTAALRRAWRGVQLPSGRARSLVVDYGSTEAIAAAIAGHDVVVNAAGYLTDPDYVPLVGRIITAAEMGLGGDGRFWLLAGAALLDVPGTQRMTLTLPKVPPQYRAHRTNYEAVRRTDLDWSVLCPGPMVASPDGEATHGLVLSTETWPVARWTLASHLPDIVTSLNFARVVPRMTIYYEDAARVIVDNLAPGGTCSRLRVGIALPAGITRHKRQDAG